MCTRYIGTGSGCAVIGIGLVVGKLINAEGATTRIPMSTKFLDIHLEERSHRTEDSLRHSHLHPRKLPPKIEERTSHADGRVESVMLCDHR